MLSTPTQRGGGSTSPSFSRPTAGWNQTISFGEAYPSGKLAVQVGERYLLVSPALLRALRHLYNANPPMEMEATVSCLSEVLPSKHAALLAQRLLQLLEPESTRSSLWRGWLRGMLRLPLWHPSGEIVERFKGRVLQPYILLAWGVILLIVLSTLGLGSLPRLGPLTPTEIAILWVLVTLTTALHEMGHMLVAANYGVRTRAVGVALFYVQPAGYADVSNAWLASRPARVAIALGGLLFQTLPLVCSYIIWRLLSVDIFGWYCVVSLIYMGFNLLPFVRLDGYWVLSHLLNEPNLRSRAFQQLKHMARPKTYAAVWTGPEGTLAAIYAWLSAVFTVGMYCSAVVAIQGFLPARLNAAVLAAAAALAAVTIATRLIVRRPESAPSSPAPLPPAQGEPGRDMSPHAVEEAGLHAAGADKPASSSRTLFVNPFRFRGTEGSELILGGITGRRVPAAPQLEFLVQSGPVSDEQLAAIPAPLLTTLQEERFLLPFDFDDGSVVARQLGFFSFWPGDPAERQRRMNRTTVVILGLGSLGSQVAYLVAAAGVGKLVLCDGDRVELSNLNRQLLYDRGDVGRMKAEAARERLLRLNPDVEVEAVCRRIETVDDVRELCSGASIVVRAIDTPLEAAYIVNEACRSLGIPHVSGGFMETWGVAGPFIGATGPCLRCISPPPQVSPADDRKVAAFGPLTFWLSSYIAGDVVRYLAGLGDPWLANQMIFFDGMRGRQIARQLEQTEEHCPVCRVPVPVGG